jgi:RNA polymerase sigma factor (sigma-70 family)
MEFDEFVTAEIEGLARYSGVLARDRQLAHDVLVDALLAASDRWSRISRMDNPLGYVRRIVATTFLADRRRESRRRTEPVPDAGAVAGVPVLAGDRPSDRARVIDDRDQTDRLLATLPPQQRAALVLRYYLDWSDEEIGVALGCTAGTVRSHVSRALATLRVTAAPMGGER